MCGGGAWLHLTQHHLIPPHLTQLLPAQPKPAYWACRVSSCCLPSLSLRIGPAVYMHAYTMTHAITCS